jgi:hypothetical protein
VRALVAELVALGQRFSRRSCASRSRRASSGVSQRSGGTAPTGARARRPRPS